MASDSEGGLEKREPVPPASPLQRDELQVQEEQQSDPTAPQETLEAIAPAEAGSVVPATQESQLSQGHRDSATILDGLEEEAAEDYAKLVRSIEDSTDPGSEAQGKVLGSAVAAWVAACEKMDLDSSIPTRETLQTKLATASAEVLDRFYEEFTRQMYDAEAKSGNLW